MRTSKKFYDQDFAAWTQTTAAWIRAGQWDDLDREALAEEIESVGKHQQQALESHLEVVLTHLLTWGYGPTLPDVRRGWRLTIREQRRRLARLLHHNPSLRPMMSTVVAESYPHARLMALEATEEPSTTFPERCLWTPAQMLEEA